MTPPEAPCPRAGVRGLRATAGATRAAVAALCLAVGVVGTPATSSADEYSDAAYFVALANDERAWYGSRPLETDGHLESIATGWAYELVGRGHLAHNPYLAEQVGEWWAWWGENVGFGRSVRAVHRAWVSSGYHYANMVDPAFSRIGVGVAYDGYGGGYIVQLLAG